MVCSMPFIRERFLGANQHLVQDANNVNRFKPNTKAVAVITRSQKIRNDRLPFPVERH